MFSSKDRPVRPSKQASNASLSTGAPSSGKQASNLPQNEGMASTSAQQLDDNARPQSIQNPSHNAPRATVNGTNGFQDADQMQVLVKSTTSVSMKYDTQLRSLVDVQDLTRESVGSVLDFIAADRLRRFPHKGSRWDKILRLAEHFANRISHFQDAVGSMFASSNQAAGMIFGSCGILLKMGPRRSDVLEVVYGVLFKMSLEIAMLLRYKKSFAANNAIKHNLACAYMEILTVISDATVQCIKNEKSSAKDLQEFYGHRVEKFYQHRERAVTALWSYQLQRSVELRNATVDISVIRDWLAPKDTVLRRLITNDEIFRAECTCEWFERHLLEFCRDREKVLLVTGAPGCGKSVLSGWIVERLQRPLGRKSFDVVSVKIDPQLKTEITSVNIIKRIVGQVFEHSVGNAALYKSLCAGMETESDGNTSGIEDFLWRSLEAALKTDENREVMVVVDGLNYTAGGENGRNALFDRLHTTCSRISNLKCVILTQSPATPFSKPSRQLVIKDEYTHDDMQHYIYEALNPYHHFNIRKEEDKRQVVSRLAGHAKGNYIFAELLTEYLKRETSNEGFTQSLSSLPNSIGDTIKRLVSRLSAAKSYDSLIVSWLVAAERPLTLAEIQCLLEIHIGGEKSTERISDIEGHFRDMYGAFFVIQDDIIRFRHISIKHNILDNSHPEILPVDRAQQDLVTRCLAYVKHHLSGRIACIEPSQDMLESRIVGEHFDKHPLLEYTVRYWTMHCRSLTDINGHGASKPTTDLMHYFPESVCFALMERSVWNTQWWLTEALEMHLFALNLRKTILKEHSCVLQCLITTASIYERLSNLVEASTFYYRASKLAQIVVGRFSTIATNLATAFLKCTASITVTERTEMVTHREELLCFIISSEEHRHGHVTEEMISYKKTLAKLYLEIKENLLAIKIQNEIYRACVELYGEDHSKTTGVHGTFRVDIPDGYRGENWEEHVLTMFAIAERTMKLLDRRRIDATLRLFEMYEIQKKMAFAEEIIVTFLHKVVHYCSHNASTENHKHKIELVMTYVSFLIRYSRKAEAQHILLGLWCEYEHQVITTFDWAITLKIVAEESRKLELVAVALSIFRSIWSFFEKAGHKNTFEAIVIAIYISEIVEETHITIIEETETIIKELYELTITKITTTTVADASTIAICETLSTFFVKKERWVNVEAICEGVLKNLWGSLLTHGHGHHGPYGLPKSFSAEAIKLALRLAYCHLQQGHVEKAERIYVFVYHSSKTSLEIGNEVVFKTARELIEFYEAIGQLEKAHTVGRELRQSYMTSLGIAHTLTLETLYLLGNLCTKHNHKDTELYYLEIYTSLEKGSDTCHQDAIDAAFGLIRLYKTTNRWPDCQTVYRCIWRTIVKRGKEYDMKADFVDNAYHNYLFVLEKKIKVDYSVLIQTSIEYRDVCVELYGLYSEISLKALVQLAAMYERSEEKRSEALTIYERIQKESKHWLALSTTTVIAILVISKSHLARLYLTSSTVTTEILIKAIVLLTEHFEHTRTAHGCAHPTTLEQLRELVQLHKRQSTKESITVVIRLVRACVIEVISKETDYKKLFDAAVSFAGNYVALDRVKEAHELLYEIRRQIIFKDFSFHEKQGFKLDHSVDRRSYVFLVAFEETLRGSKIINFSTIMTDLLTETILHELYMQAVEQNLKFETKLLRGARLRVFHKSKNYDDHAKQLEDDLLALFQGSIGSSIKTSQESVRRFFIILLQELGRDEVNIHIVNSACKAGADAVYRSIDQRDFKEAFELATSVLQFTKAHHGFQDQHNFRIGFKLSLALAGRGRNRCENQKLRDQMLNLSKTILQECIHSSKAVNFKFIELEIKELNNIIGVLGEQHNFADLEWLLTHLWCLRDDQTHWSSSTVTWIGRRLVEVRYSHGQRDSAIALLQDIIYNMRRVWGALDKSTLANSTLLSELYTVSGKHADAIAVHEGCLRDLINDELDEPIPKDVGKIATVHAELLKRAYQRNGGWDKDPGSYIQLYQQLSNEFKSDADWKTVQSIDKWQPKGADALGVFKEPDHWEFLEQDVGGKHENILRRLEKGLYAGGKRNGVAVSAVEVKEQDVD